MLKFRESTGNDEDLGKMYSLFAEAFPDEDERESLENLAKFVSIKVEGVESHILHLKTGSNIIGSMVFAYFHQSNTGYISYIVVDKAHKNKGFATKIFDEGMRILGEDAKKINKRELGYVFLELDKFDPNKIPAAAHIWHKKGFKRLDFDYTQPPLDKNKCESNSLMLAVRVHTNEEYLESNIVKLFIADFFGLVFEIEPPLIKEYIERMCKRLGDSDVGLMGIINPSMSS
ncbi:MAG: GNAT family N-acetyltransferase [Turicibacter sp.]|nr:GNAT family N-acetyltransferase [Turicibacter sp.]